MNKYSIELIECVKVYYPTYWIVDVEAKDLKEALDKVFTKLDYNYYVPDEAVFNEAIEDCEEEWGIAGNELTALAYNKTLDDKGSSCRLLKGKCNGSKLFDLLIEESLDED